MRENICRYEGHPLSFPQVNFEYRPIKEYSILEYRPIKEEIPAY